MRDLVEQFASLNGWTISSYSFTPDYLGKRRAAWNCRYPDFYDIVDHAHWFRGDGKNIALITQPYADYHDFAERISAHAARHAFTWHASPVRRASFWAPGIALFFVLIPPGVRVKFLPEQCLGVVEPATAA